MGRGVTALGAVVGLHLVVVAGHAAAHVGAPVALAAWQQAFVAAFVVVGPLAGLALVRAGRPNAGGAVVAGSMGAALAFGLWFHFLVPNPDHVHAVVGAWRVPFGATAALLAVTELAGVAVGARAVVRPG